MPDKLTPVFEFFRAGKLLTIQHQSHEGNRGILAAMDTLHTSADSGGTETGHEGAEGCAAKSATRSQHAPRVPWQL